MAKAVIAADRTQRSARKYFDDLDRLFGASIGVVFVRTREMERVRSLTHEWSSLQGHDYHVWDHNHGFRSYRALPTNEQGQDRQIVYDAERLEQYLLPHQTIEGTVNLFAALEHMEMRGQSNGGLQTNVADDFSSAFVGAFIDPTLEELDNPIFAQFMRDHVQKAHASDDRIFVFIQPHIAVPENIRADVTLIDLDPPSFIELVDTLRELAETSIKEALDYELTNEDIEEISQNGLGMAENEFSNAVSIATVELAKLSDTQEPTAADFVKIVRQSKLELIRQTEVLDFIEPADIATVGGLDLLKADLQKQRKAFTPEAREFGLDMPKGYIVVGPPGTGKTLICKATSGALGLPAIVFNLSAVFSSYVGSSEQRMRANLKFVEAMAPCILFFDEFDKAVPQGNENDSGTSSRILGTLLTWLNDRQERGVPVYVIASANDVSRLPPEILRKGRFDNIWAVSMPSPTERAAIVKIHAEKRGHTLKDDEYKRIANASNMFVGAELESVVVAALLEDFHEGNDTITCDNVITAIEGTTPQAKAFPERIKFMRDWAEKNAKQASSGGNFDGDEPETTARGKTPRRITPLRKRPSGGAAGRD